MIKALFSTLAVLVVSHSMACSTTTPPLPTVALPAMQEPNPMPSLSEDGILASGPLYFDSDDDGLGEDALATLRLIAKFMEKSPKARVVVSGHCDERGDEGYNLALGERRGGSARRYLTDLGVDPTRVRVISFGEEQPAVDGSFDLAWSMNRRDEFTFVRPGSKQAALFENLEVTATWR